MINIFKHLLPNARAWRITIDKTLRRFFEGLTGIGEDVKDFFDLVWSDLNPQLTRELDAWENQFGMLDTGLNEQGRRDRIDGAWKALGGQSPRYIQDTLQAAGFDVYVHEWYEPSVQHPTGGSVNGDTPAIGPRLDSWVTRTSAADNTWQSVTWSPELSLFVAVSNSGVGNRVMSSPDGVNWTSRTSAADNKWRSVAWSPELLLFVAVANSGTGNRVMSSPDGINWTIRTSAADNDWRGVTWSPELLLFVAVAISGTGNRVMSSPDGINWTIRTSATDNDWRGVAWSPELLLFVAVSSIGTGNRVMSSSDGVNWTIRTSAADNSWLSVTWSPELSIFAAVANSGTNDRVMTSVNRSAVRSPFDYLDDGTSGIPFLMVDGGTDAQDGATVSQDGGTGTPAGYPLVNKVLESTVAIGMQDNGPDSQDGDSFAQDGGGVTLFSWKQYEIPADATKYPYFLYIGGKNFPDIATVPTSRQDEFEDLCLKICPTEQWLGMLVNYS